MSKRKQQPAVFWAAIVALVGVLCAASAGCGSGGHGTSGVNAPINSSVITRTTETTISDDAKILATREATGAFVSLDMARAFDADLAAVRAVRPDTQNVHARFDVVPKTLIIDVKPTAPWLIKWNASASASAPTTTTDTDLTTGEPALDALLKKYDATRTTDATNYENRPSFLLHFAQSLNMRVVAAEFAQSSASLEAVYTDNIIGDGNNLYFKPDANGAGKVYTFSLGYGDCPAGCTNRYDFSYLLHGDGSITP